MSYTFIDQGTSRQLGTSHTVALGSSPAGSFEYLIFVSEDDPGDWFGVGTGITDPAGWTPLLAVGSAISKPSYDPGNFAHQIWYRTSDGDVSAVDVVTTNSIRAGLLRASFSGHAGTATPVAAVYQYENDPLTNPVTNTDTSTFGTAAVGDLFCLVILAETAWNPGGLGASMGQGPLDTNSYSVGHVRIIDYHIGNWLIPINGDPFQFECNYFV